MVVARNLPPISPNPNSPNPYMFGLGIGLGMGLGIGLGSGIEYFRQYNVIRRIGIRRNGAEPRVLLGLISSMHRPTVRPTCTCNLEWDYRDLNLGPYAGPFCR